MRILVWFRKDLRLDDHTALAEAARDAAGEVVPFYASEPSRLGRDDIAPARVRFVLESLADLVVPAAHQSADLDSAARVVLHEARGAWARESR